jgi:hypothetical protein
VYLDWTVKIEWLDIYLSEVLHCHQDKLLYLFVSYQFGPVGYLRSASVVTGIYRLSPVVIHSDIFLLSMENFVFVMALLAVIVMVVIGTTDRLGLPYNLLLLPVLVVRLVEVIL